MKKFSKKILISVIAMLVLFATAFAALSFTMADEENSATKSSVYAATGPKTIIDYIIENSKATATDADPVYHILELGSSDERSDLFTLVNSGNFKANVINGNKSKDYPNTMDDAAQIEYRYFNATEGNLGEVKETGSGVAKNTSTNDDIVKAIQKADLIYVSNDPNKIFQDGNDITEEIKIALSSYATGDQKPLIIDSHNKTQEVINLTSKKMKEIATYDFAPYGGTYSTYMWDNIKSAGEFMDLSNLADLYIPIDGDEQKSKWFEVSATGTSEYVAKVLTINAGSDNTLTNLFKAGFSSSPDYTGKADVNGQAVPDAYTLPTSSGVYIHGYYGRATRPTAFTFETLDLSTNIADLADPTKYDLSDYDFVIIEKDTAEINFLSNMPSYNALMGGMYGYTHILYDKSMVMNATNNTISPCTAANFKYVYDKVATPTDNPRFKYIMINTRSKMSGYAASVSPEGVKDIADVINAGSFRGIKTNSGDDSSNVYTALEIEPCYPVNSQLAGVFTDKGVENYTDNYSAWGATAAQTFKNATGRSRITSTTEGSGWWGSKGFYYLRTSGVLDVSSDEISYDGNMSVTEMLDSADYSSITSDNSDNIVDYYSWTLTNAKVAHALGVSADEVRVVHMSSVEFAASKDTLLDSYDMIYIGGDTSSIQDTKYLNAGNSFYRMYRHNGETYSYPSTDFTGQKDGTENVLVGNDITDDKLDELKEYVSHDMPVIFDKEVTKSFNAGTDIDPQSNMYAFLTYASGTSFTSNTIWNFDQDYTIKLANIGNKYGRTYSGYATVFAKDKTTGYSDDEKSLIMGVRHDTKSDPTQTIDDYLSANLEDSIQCETQLSNLIQTHQRPRLAVTLMPKRFVEGNVDSWIESDKTTGTNLVWNYKVNGETDGSVDLYIDDDSNNRFTASEKRASGKNGTVTLHLGADYYGPVYWKIIATDANGLSASTTGICKIKRREDQEKLVVDLLEIQPPMTASENNKCTLLFCTECQQTGALMYGNRSADVGMFSKDATSGLSSGFRDHSRLYADTTSTDPGMDTFDETKSVIKKDPLNVFDYSVTTIPTGLQDSINDYVAFKYMNESGTGYSEYDNNLGIHEHKFGIVKYYENFTLLDLNGGTIAKGLDDWTTNWFDELRYDYDVNLTTMTTRQYEAVVNLVNNIYAGQSETDAKNISDEFTARKTDYKLYYDCMRALINGNYDTAIPAANKAKFVSFMTTANNDPTAPGLGLTSDDLKAFAESSANLDAYLLGTDNGVTNAASFTDKTRTDYGVKEIQHLTDSSIPADERQYYDIYSLVNSRSGKPFFDGYDKLYQVWRNAKMYEIYFKNQYVKYSLLASANISSSDYSTASYKNTISLDKTFNCVLFGASEDFNDDDLRTDASCYAILDYVEDDGNILLFHDTLTARKTEKGNGTERMTRLLGDAFGLEARHFEYYTNSSDYEQVKNKLNITFGGVNKSITVDEDATEIEIVATKSAPKDKSVSFVGHANDGRADQTLSAINLSKNVTEADLYIIMDSSGKLVSSRFVSTGAEDAGSHNIKITPYLCVGSATSTVAELKANLWHDQYYTPPVGTQPWAVYNSTSNLNKIDFVADGATYEMPVLLDGSGSFSIPNSAVSIGDPTVKTRYGAGFDMNTEITQKLTFTAKDSDGNGVTGIAYSVSNETKGDTANGSTVSGTAVYEFTNMIPKQGSSVQVRVKSPYRNTEYFVSPSKGSASQKFTNASGNLATPNILTLTNRCAMYRQMDTGGNQKWPTKYTFFDYHGESVRDDLHRDHDMREIIHTPDKGNTDSTSQTNKGIVTMYPFTIGNKMKISNTTSQSFVVDVEDPDVTVYYTLAGSTAGMVSNMYAADPHNTSENYFIYQKANVTYTGAGHSAVTGYGRDNNDERRLFINIIVNSARKSTSGPDLKLYDYGSTVDDLKNEVVRVVNDSDADYAMRISDYTDDVWFDYLANMAAGTKFDWVQIFFDVDREGSDIEVLSADDVLIFEGDKDSATGEVHEDIPNNIGDGLLKEVKTGIPHLAKDTSNVPNLVLKESYFNSDNKAYIIVRVRDSKGNEDFKRLRIEFKPDLIDLN